jgi:hypothetical protein
VKSLLVTSAQESEARQRAERASEGVEKPETPVNGKNKPHPLLLYIALPGFAVWDQNRLKPQKAERAYFKNRPR